MLYNPTPAALLDQQAKVLRAQLDGVYDGRVDAVHDARVATRRIRELLTLAAPGENANEDLAEAYKEVGRALGRVRDIDVQIGLIRDLERHAPQTAASLVLVRQDHERDRLAAMRRLIKTLEQLDVEAVLGRIALAIAPAPAAGSLQGLAPSPATPVARTRQRRRGENRARHGCLFSESRAQRPHCRQEAPLCGRDQPGDRRFQSQRRNQELAQGAGGARRDSRSWVAVRHPARYLALDHVNNDHIAQTTQVLEGEILDLHARYLARRSAIRDACAEIERLSLRGSKAGPALAVGGGILVAALAYLNNRAPQSKKPLMQVKGRLAV